MGDADDASELEAEASAGKKKKQNNRVSYLPQELISTILLLVPAQALHGLMRHVCREWNVLIRSQDFIYGHLRNSAGGILFHDARTPHSTVYAEMRGNRIEISSMPLDCGRIRNSCNGLILSHYPEKQYDLPFIINPLTNQRTTLPPYDRSDESWAYFAIAFAEASMEYKVVCSHGIDDYGTMRADISVLTIGVDGDWRDICVDHLTPAKRTTLFRTHHVAGGYVHWVGGYFVLTLNVETEEFRHFPLPKSLRRRTDFLPMGGKLTAVDRSRKFSMYVWEMDSESGEWTLLHYIDLKPMGSILYGGFRKVWKPLWPLGWLVAGEVLALKAGNGYEGGYVYVAYNVKTKCFQSFEVAGVSSSAFLHVNSLVLV